MRLNFETKRAHYIPEGAIEKKDPESSAVVYLHDYNGKPALVAFSGNRSKPDRNLYYSTEERRDADAIDFIDCVRRSEQLKREQKQARESSPLGVEVGDILVSSWGYEQTNIDYYQVIKICGKRTIELRKIKREITGHDSHASGRCVPLPDQFISEPFRKQCRNGEVKIASFAYAHKMHKDEFGNYRESNWTAWY